MLPYIMLTLGATVFAIATIVFTIYKKHTVALDYLFRVLIMMLCLYLWKRDVNLYAFIICGIFTASNVSLCLGYFAIAWFPFVSNIIGMKTNPDSREFKIEHTVIILRTLLYAFIFITLGVFTFGGDI